MRFLDRLFGRKNADSEYRFSKTRRISDDIAKKLPHLTDAPVHVPASRPIAELIVDCSVDEESEYQKTKNRLRVEVPEKFLDNLIAGEKALIQQEKEVDAMRKHQPIGGLRQGKHISASTIKDWFASRRNVDEKRKYDVNQRVEESRQLGFDGFRVTDQGLLEVFGKEINPPETVVDMEPGKRVRNDFRDYKVTDPALLKLFGEEINQRMQ